jgi:KUP system potassium uptake protein
MSTPPFKIRITEPPTGDGTGSPSATANHGIWTLTIGSIGVVFGDIGTSPLYAMREALAHSSAATEPAVLGVVSLVFWALTLIVTIKYVLLVLRADNKGEGGTLALMALAQHIIGHRTRPIFLLGVCGAALFYGDSLITPAISVLSAAEGIVAAPGIGEGFQPYVLPTAGVILIALFMVQARGTARVGWYFGPIMVVWFLVLAALGLSHIFREPSVLRGLSPSYGIDLIVENGLLGFAILGSVFLVVTGAEALYADIGHFGKFPIRIAWLGLAFPSLMLNYLGQGALVLADPSTQADPFFRMIPASAYWPVLVLTTAATVIASQAVITGAFSVTQQAVQLGLLPRVTIKRTSETVAGQIYVPAANWLLLTGVLLLLVMFKNSSNLAAAYGIAVTATMVVTVLLLYVIAIRYWKWPTTAALAVLLPFLLIDLIFLGSNTLKIPQGGWFPLALGAGLVMIIRIWTKGTRILTDKAARDTIALADLIQILERRPPNMVRGTAIFFTSTPRVAPIALLHNLKHNQVLHDSNIILTVATADIPRVADSNRISVETLSPRFKRVNVCYGFMESPDIPSALALAREHGLKLDAMSTSFFLGRRSVVPSSEGMPLWQDWIFIFLMQNAATPTGFFKIPPGRVVELGAKVTV